MRRAARDARSGTLPERLELGEGCFARDVFHAAIGGRDQPLGRQVREGGTDAGGHCLGRLRVGFAHADDAEDHGLAAEAIEGREVEIPSIEICSTTVPVSSGRNA